MSSSQHDALVLDELHKYRGAAGALCVILAVMGMPEWPLRALADAIFNGLSGVESLESFLPKGLHLLKMRLGFVSLGAVAAASGLVQAQCPDFTTFSQVS